MTSKQRECIERETGRKSGIKLKGGGGGRGERRKGETDFRVCEGRVRGRRGEERKRGVDGRRGEERKRGGDGRRGKGEGTGGEGKGGLGQRNAVVV